jgi:hypothetical protein
VMKNDIRQANTSKKLVDPWQMIPYVSLTDRKAVTWSKTKSQKIKTMEVTSLKNY